MKKNGAKILKFEGTNPRKTSRENPHIDKNDVVMGFEDLQSIGALNNSIGGLLENSIIEPDGDAFHIHKSFKERELDGIFVYGHYSKKAIMLFKEGVLPKVLADKSDWLFLVEGSELPMTPEVRYYKGVAEKLKIPIANPLVNPYTRIIAEKCGIDRLEAIQVALLNELPRYQDENLLKRYLSLSFDTDEKIVRGLMIYMGVMAQEDREEFNRFRQEMYKIFSKILDSSNDLSRLKLEKLLEQNPNKRLFAHAGDGHLPLFDERYSPKSKFSEKDLEEVIRYDKLLNIQLATGIRISTEDIPIRSAQIRNGGLHYEEMETQRKARYHEINEQAKNYKEATEKFIGALCNWSENIYPGRERKISSDEYFKRAKESDHSLSFVWGVSAYINEQIERGKKAEKVAPRLKLLLKEAAGLRRSYSEKNFEELSILADNAKLIYEIYTDIKCKEKAADKVSQDC